MEEYKQINDFSNYLISNFGNVKNLKTNRILKPSICKKGYQYVSLNNDDISKKIKIHRLVASVFIPNPFNKTIIDHKDNNRINNKVDNLRWATDKENQMNRVINKNNKSGYKGITYNEKTKKWRVKIKNIHIGYFDNIEDAARERLKKAEELFGNFMTDCENKINI